MHRCSRGAAASLVTAAAMLLALLSPSQSRANAYEPKAGSHAAYGVAENSSVNATIEHYIITHAGSFSGAWLNRRQHVINIGVTIGTPAGEIRGLYQAAASSTPAGSREPLWRLSFIRAAYSLSRLSRTMKSVITDKPWVELSARYLASWYINNRADCVVVGLTRVTAQLRRMATATFGSRVQINTMPRPTVEVFRQPLHVRPRLVHIRPAPASSPSACSRTLDCTPYWGGDRLVWFSSSEIIECTQAFPWTPAGKTNTFTMSLTAGHCGPTGRTWDQGYYNASKNTVYYTGVAGKDTDTSWGNNRADGEVLSSADMSNLVYANSSLTGSAATIEFYSQPLQGEVVCADGSFTYQNCNGVVQSTNVCANVSDDGTIVKVCDLAYATAASRLDQPGDSGGPVYDYASTNPPDVTINGLISAGNSSGTELFFSNVNGLNSTLKGHPTT